MIIKDELLYKVNDNKLKVIYINTQIYCLMTLFTLFWIKEFICTHKMKA